MENSVLFNNPIVLVGYMLALIVAVAALVKNLHPIISVISVLTFVAVTTYSLLIGAPLYEIGAVAALFFAVHIFSLQRKGGE